MKRREFLRRTGVLTAAAAGAAPAPAFAKTDRTFRWAFVAAETGFDPAQINDLYSNYVISNIIEPPLQYDYLARPAVIKPCTAAAMPEIAADFRTLTVRIRPGILFQADPAFKGARRELVAADYVYQLKRVADPRWKSPQYPTIEGADVLGLAGLRKEALATGKFDYDRPIDGARALDRFTFQLRLGQAAPRFHELLTDARVFGGVAREVVEFYGADIMAHPVGTGPFRLVQWKRSSFMALERNPDFREEYYDAQPAPGDSSGRALVDRLRGRKLPLVERVELSVIEESQPRWLAFLNGQQDTVNVPLNFINLAVPNGALAPSLQRQGIRLERTINPDIVITFFNMDDPVIGGYTADKVALRRAISLGYNLDEEIRLIRRGSMMPAQSQVPPLTDGYHPHFVSEMSRYNPAEAHALLDLYGFLDRNGDGWRELPDGSPLVIEMASESSQLDREFNEMWRRQMDHLRIRIEFRINQWPENLKAARSGKLMTWILGNTASVPDCDDFLAFGSSHDIGSSNFARFRLADYDRLYGLQRQLPNGPERDAAIYEMKRLFNVYMPYKVHGHRFNNDLSQPWLIGYRRHPFASNFFKYVDIDLEARVGG